MRDFTISICYFPRAKEFNSISYLLLIKVYRSKISILGFLFIIYRAIKKKQTVSTFYKELFTSIPVNQFKVRQYLQHFFTL